MRKKILAFLLLLTTYFLLPTTIYAVCPVCTIAVGAGLGVSRALGIDDAVTSVWIGGLIISMSFWLYDWISKKKPAWHKTPYLIIITALMFLITLLPLYFDHLIGRAYNTLYGIDKVLFGTVIGSVMFLFGVWVDKKVRQVKGKQLFNFQKVVFPVSALLLSSLFLELFVRSYK